jgi:hypothetical protein
MAQWLARVDQNVCKVHCARNESNSIEWRVRAAREEKSEMNPYAIVGLGIGTAEAASLRARLIAWHDAMVAHERRLRSGQTTDACDDECPHVEARTLWAEVSAMLGPRASELTFLRSRRQDASASSDPLIVSAKTVSQEADTVHRSRAPRADSSRRPSQSSRDSSDPPQMATAEL